MDLPVPQQAEGEPTARAVKRQLQKDSDTADLVAIPAETPVIHNGTGTFPRDRPQHSRPHCGSQDGQCSCTLSHCRTGVAPPERPGPFGSPSARRKEARASSALSRFPRLDRGQSTAPQLQSRRPCREQEDDPHEAEGCAGGRSAAPGHAGRAPMPALPLVVLPTTYDSGFYLYKMDHAS